MTPEELQKATKEVEKKASKLNEELTQLIADGIMHRFNKYGEVKLSASDEYRILTLKRAGITYEDIMQAIQSKTSGLDRAIRDVFKATAKNLGYVKTNSYVQEKIQGPVVQNESGTTAKRIKRGFNASDFSKEQRELLEDVYSRTQNELNDFYGKTAYNGVKIYQNAVDEAIHKIQSGMGWQKAVREAIKEVAKKGMYVEYPSGRMDTIETAILRAVRTGVNQANSKMVLERAKAEGQDLILVSSHLDARPEHQVWQGKIYSLSGTSKKYPEFYSSTGYGTATGLCGINCRHTIMIYYPGITRNPFKRYNRPANVKRYELSQQQRKMEREIRKTRRRKDVLENSKKNTTDPEMKRQLNEEIQIESDKLRAQKEAYNAFVEKHARKKDHIRTYAPKFDAARFRNSIIKIKNAAHSINTGKRVYYNETRSYKINLESYSEKVNDNLSKAAREVAKLGDRDGKEHGVFVDLNTGEIGKYVTNNDAGSVRPDYKFLIENPNAKVAFLHNHNEDTELSFPDVGLIANEYGINVVAAVRNDGIITLVESNGRKTSKYLPLEYLEYANKIRNELMSENGFVSELEMEIRLRDKAIQEYAQKGMQVYGDST